MKNNEKNVKKKTARSFRPARFALYKVVWILLFIRIG